MRLTRYRLRYRGCVGEGFQKRIVWKDLYSLVEEQRPHLVNKKRAGKFIQNTVSKRVGSRHMLYADDFIIFLPTPHENGTNIPQIIGYFLSSRCHRHTFSNTIAIIAPIFVFVILFLILIICPNECPMPLYWMRYSSLSK